MEPDCRALIVDRIRQKGPITVAEYMDLALYAPGAGYYARAIQRSGRAGDFVTSVDVGPLFGELLSIEFGLMWRALLRAPDPLSSSFQLVESAAGNGRLSRDVLDAAVRRDPEFYRAQIKTARLIACPGCYPTSILLGCAPALKRGLIKPETIIASSLSGVSGGATVMTR